MGFIFHILLCILCAASAINKTTILQSLTNIWLILLSFFSDTDLS